MKALFQRRAWVRTYLHRLFFNSNLPRKASWVLRGMWYILILLILYNPNTNGGMGRSAQGGLEVKALFQHQAPTRHLCEREPHQQGMSNKQDVVIVMRSGNTFLLILAQRPRWITLLQNSLNVREETTTQNGRVLVVPRRVAKRKEENRRR